MTYAIVARDFATREIGAAVQSHFFNVGGITMWAEPGIGVIATLAIAEISYGRRGLELMKRGRSGPEALNELLAKDDKAAIRQVGMLALHGPAAAHTGAHCMAMAGHRAAEHAAACGNLLTRDGTWDQMVEAFQSARGDLSARLLAALNRAEAVGGDIRGKQSAALLVVSTRRDDEVGQGAQSDRQVTLRVEDHPDPLAELERLLALDRFYKDLLAMLGTSGLYQGPFDADAQALERAIATLRAGQSMLGDNQEATFWLAVLLARAGRMADARREFHAAVAGHPPLRELAARITAKGMLTQGQYAKLASD